MEEDVITTIKGLFTKNMIIQPDGTRLKCQTYESLRKEIEFQFGYFNIKKINGVNCIIQFVPA